MAIYLGGMKVSCCEFEIRGDGREYECGQATGGLLGQAVGLKTMSKGFHIQIPPVTEEGWKIITGEWVLVLTLEVENKGRAWN